MDRFRYLFQQFSACFHDGWFEQYGEIGGIERAVGFGNLEKRKELLDFLLAVKAENPTPERWNEIWSKGESPYYITRETINSFFELIIEKLEEAVKTK
ncbi:hypothetical protein GCM10011390_11660 [Aureimonas endophytica]|uniref:CdiI immunity protein domain-containing protein n=1 Tax=Aureimonas endophytica TaxID=2027858 RepID=A0A916ZGK9_9HYPH|nr:hypothetical protein [Aureimonas endophytica]GGD94573.1 hypothetical protein GCM10011390_11660 [Aureimonas endophytica]